MISVQNHQLRLSGNNVLVCLSVLFLLSSCALFRPTVVVPLGKNDKKVDEQSADAKNDKNKNEANNLAKDRNMVSFNGYQVKSNKIALLLPFQLQKNGTSLGVQDVNRSALALDFYQGFQVAMNQLADQGANLYVQVVDSKDDALYNNTLWNHEQVKDAALVIGPVFPREIKGFAQGIKNKSVLQVSPLAASMASDYALPNLVSMTPSIRTHCEILAKYVADQYSPGDKIIIYNSGDEESKQFLNTFATTVLKNSSYADVKTIYAARDLSANVNSSVIGTTHIVVGSSNRTAMRDLLFEMENISNKTGNAFRLYGHPNISKLAFSKYPNFNAYRLTITSSNMEDQNVRQKREFDALYFKNYHISPSEYAYKGYDTGMLFGKLVDKYGVNYAQHLLDKKIFGLTNDYQFQFYPNWGYINRSLGLLEYQDNQFVRLSYE